MGLRIIPVREEAGLFASFPIRPAIDLTGWTFACDLTRQAGSVDLSVAMAEAADADGFWCAVPSAGSFTMRLSSDALTGIADTTGDFVLRGSIFGTDPSDAVHLIVDLELRVRAGAGGSEAPPVLQVQVAGLPGASVADVARRTGMGGVAAADDDATAVEKVLAEIVGPIRDEAAGLAVEAGAAAAAAASSAARLTPFIAAPPPGSALEGVLSVDFFRYIGIVALTVPTEPCVREFSRDALNRHRGRFADRAGGAYTIYATESAGLASKSVAGVTGEQTFDAFAAATHPDVVSGAIPVNTKIGTYRHDWKTGGQIGTYQATIDYEAGGLKRANTLPTIAADANTTALVETNPTVEASLMTWCPFAARPGGANAYLLGLQVEVWPSVTLSTGAVVNVPWPDDARCLEYSVQAGTNRLRARFGTQAGAPLAGESNLTNQWVAVPGGNGRKRFPLYADGANLAGIPDDTQIGWIRHNHKGPVGGYQSIIPASVGTLVKERVQAATDAIDARIAVALAAERGRSRDLYISTVSAPVLRDYVVDIVGEEFNEGEQYGLDRIEFTHIPGVPQWRFTADVWNFTRGHKVGRAGVLWNQEPVANGLMPPGNWFAGHLSTLGADQYTGQHFLLKLADGPLPWVVGNGATSFATYAACGIRPEKLKTSEQLDRDWFGGPDGPTPVETVLIGPGRPFTTLVEATRSYNLPGEIGTGTHPSTARVSNARPIAFDLLADPHVEDPNGLVLLPGQIIRGLGPFRTLLDGDGVGRLWEGTFSWTMMDLAMRQPADAYLGHVDNFNSLSRPSMIGDLLQHYIIRQNIIRCLLTLYDEQGEWGIGTGLSSAQIMNITQSWFMRHNTATNAFLGIHNAPGASYNREQRPGLVNLDGVFANDALGAAVGLLGSFPQTTRHRVRARNCQLNQIAGQVLIADNDPNMPRRARDRWPYQVWVEGGDVGEVRCTDAKMRVAAVAAGTRVSGTLANAVFGFFDPISGRGDQLMLDASIWSAGKNIGDRSAVDGTLVFEHPTLGTEIVTLSGHDFRGDAEGAVLAAINAQLTNFNVTGARIDTLIDGAGR